MLARLSSSLPEARERIPRREIDSPVFRIFAIQKLRVYMDLRVYNTTSVVRLRCVPVPGKGAVFGHPDP